MNDRNDWPHKERDLAIADTVMSEVASLNEGILNMLEDYQDDAENEMMTFQFPVWVVALIKVFKTLYKPEECAEVMDNVLQEILKGFKGLPAKDAEFFRKLVKFALQKNLAPPVLH